MSVSIKRVYDDPAAADGYRVLVDRLWPRGVSKSRAALDEWLKDVAPSPELRTWWNHDPALLGEFTQRYESELDSNAAVTDLRAIVAGHPVVTLVYGARDPKINHAAVLARYLQSS